jgi:ankyrin repeat protein
VGDNSSALLLSLLALEAPFLPTQQENIEKVVMLLLGEMQKINSERVKLVINTRHMITKRVPLNIALNLGKLALTNKLLSFGADPNMEIGGDDHTPIYESITAYGHFYNLKSYGDFKNQIVRSTPNKMRMETGPDLLRAIEMDSSPETVRRLMQKSFELLYKQKPKSIKPYERIIRTLVEHGADLNMLNSNGWFPLDMARELRDETLIQLITRLGAYKTAIL